MPPASPRALVVAVALAVLAAAAGAAPAQPPTPPPAPSPAATPGRAVANDNRVAAGTRRGATLVLALVAREAEWHPDGDAAPGAPMQAFAEEGGAPRIPGPLLRVRAGTAAEVTVRNALPDTLRVYGLVDRRSHQPTDADTVPLVVPPGERKSARLRLDAPGTYLYWGSTTRRAIIWRTGRDAQLTAAIVVDSAHADPRRPRDRVLVLGSWSDTVHRAGVRQSRVLAVVNGRAWPHTERLAYDEGDTVRLRVVSGSADLHPVHLHGAYFRVRERIDGLPGRGGVPADAPTLVVTEPVRPASSIAIDWVATRPGNWLLHCHIPEHFAARGPLGVARTEAQAAHAAHAADHALGGMGGMVVGITVAPKHPGGRATATAVSRVATGPPGAPPRRLRLLVRATVGSTDSVPLYAYAAQEGDAAEPPPDTGLVTSPTLDLVRGEPVAITVVNRLTEATAVHWHGIELESYYDGVPGFSGAGRQTTPMIAPGDSFVVRFTPPRSGTFIYHTHAHEERQQTAGLAGAIVVREPGTRRDPAMDVPIVLTSPVEFALGMRALLFNARREPPALVMTAGRTYRLRLVQMSVPRAAFTLQLRGRTAAGADTLLAWRLVAKDGADAPSETARVARVASQILAVGETVDVEVTPEAPGALQLDAVFGLGPTGRPAGPVFTMGTYPIRVLPRERADASSRE